MTFADEHSVSRIQPTLHSTLRSKDTLTTSTPSRPPPHPHLPLSPIHSLPSSPSSPSPSPVVPGPSEVNTAGYFSTFDPVATAKEYLRTVFVPGGPSPPTAGRYGGPSGPSPPSSGGYSGNSSGWGGGRHGANNHGCAAVTTATTPL